MFMSKKSPDKDIVAKMALYFKFYPFLPGLLRLASFWFQGPGLTIQLLYVPVTGQIEESRLESS